MKIFLESEDKFIAEQSLFVLFNLSFLFAIPKFSPKSYCLLEGKKMISSLVFLLNYSATTKHKVVFS